MDLFAFLSMINLMINYQEIQTYFNFLFLIVILIYYYYKYINNYILLIIMMQTIRFLSKF